MADRSLSDVGGTPGGLGQFLIGLVMSCVGGYLLSNQVSVIGSYWSFWGTNSFGITLIPMLFGAAILILQRQERDRVVPDHRWRAFYPGRRNCQHAHLLSANQPF